MEKKQQLDTSRENFNESETITKKIGETYRYCRKQIDYFEYTNCVRENQVAYDRDRALVRLIELTLENCSEDTKQIIRNQYLEVKEAKWYRDYYSSSTYYRLRRKAIEEFLNSLKE